jgi:hypothetical protein
VSKRLHKKLAPVRSKAYSLPMPVSSVPPARAHRNARISVRLTKANEASAENVTLSPEEEKDVRWYADLLGYTSVSTFIRECAESAGPVPEMAAHCHLSTPEYLRTVVLAAIDNTSLASVLATARSFVRTKVGLPR